MNAKQLLWDFGGRPQEADRSRAEFIAARLSESPTGEVRLMEMICEPENVREALKRVERNAGVPGVDGMKTTQLRGYLRRHWGLIRMALLEGSYKPQPVKRVEIPKPEGGGVRLLGIPTVLDRMIQQMTAQVLNQLWDHTFSEFSFGFRPERSQHQAIQQAHGYVQEGYTQVVDFDLSKFFDRVHHDRLMQRIAGRVADKRVLKLIRRCLKSGILVGELIVEPEEGTPQGGPLSPLLANIVLDELDKELERRGLRFVRYADDFMVYVRSRKAAERVMIRVTRFIERRLKLVVNETKSCVTRPWDAKYLGFRITRIFGRTLIGVHAKSLRRFRETIRERTSRSRGRSAAQIIGDLNDYLRGWRNYFAPGLSATLAGELDHWICRRLRAYVWSQWKLPRTRVRNLESRGVLHQWAVMVGNTRRGPWRLSKHGSVCQALPDAYFTRDLGLVTLS